MVSLWTSTEENHLKELVPQGLSARMMAEKIGGGKSRCSVIGKLHRLGIRILSRVSDPSLARPKKARAKRKRNPSAPPFALDSRPGESSQALEVLAYTPLLEPLEFAPIPLLETIARQCRWIEDDDAMCCGRNVKFESSYCPFHHNRVYQQVPKRTGNPMIFGHNGR